MAKDLHRRQSALVAALMRRTVTVTRSRRRFLRRNHVTRKSGSTRRCCRRTIIDLLIKGIIDREKIGNELSASSYFLTVEDEPAWRTVWHLHERTEDEFNRARADLEKEFVAREFRRPARSCTFSASAFGLGASACCPHAVSGNRSVQAYVDDLYAAQRLELKIRGTAPLKCALTATAAWASMKMNARVP